MITPPNGIVLDMFAGSGSTGVACVQNGFRYILVEQEQEYIDIIHARLAHAHHAVPVQEQEDVEYLCSENCPVRVLGEMSGVSRSGGKPGKFYDVKDGNEYGGSSFKLGGAHQTMSIADTGTAARFFKTFPPEPSLWDTDEEAL